MCTALALVAGLAVALPLAAQTQPARQGSPSQPGSSSSMQPAAPAQSMPQAPAPAKPTTGPYLRLSNPRDLTLTALVTLHSESSQDRTRIRDPHTGKVAEMPHIAPFTFTSLRMVWPLVPESATSSMFADFPPAPANAPAQGQAQPPQKVEIAGGRLTVNDQITDEEPELLVNYPGPSKLLAVDVLDKAGVTARQVQMRVEVPTRSWRSLYDERAANKVDWPSRWPAEAQELLRPQAFVEFGYDEKGKQRAYDDKGLEAALANWYREEGISDPKKFSPSLIAKLIAHRVWGAVQPTGDGYLYHQDTGEFAGFALQAPSDTLATGRGSPHDMTTLVAALLRKAGIPARTVIGVDSGSGRGNGIKREGSQNRLRSWVEFCLFDEEKNTVNWVPVDIARLRETGTRARPLTEEWPFFGTHGELDRVAVVAFHFHPPTDVVSYGGPAIWGWFVTPRPPQDALQSLTISAATSSTRGGQKKSVSIKEEREALEARERK